MNFKRSKLIIVQEKKRTFWQWKKSAKKLLKLNFDQILFRQMVRTLNEKCKKQQSFYLKDTIWPSKDAILLTPHYWSIKKERI